jgi:hypothetical protein
MRMLRWVLDVPNRTGYESAGRRIGVRIQDRRGASGAGGHRWFRIARRAEQKCLAEWAAERLERDQLLVGLGPFGDGVHPWRLAKPDDGVGQRQLLCYSADSVYERAVDLEDVGKCCG